MIRYNNRCSGPNENVLLVTKYVVSKKNKSTVNKINLSRTPPKIYIIRIFVLTKSSEILERKKSLGSQSRKLPLHVHSSLKNTIHYLRNRVRELSSSPVFFLKMSAISFSWESGVTQNVIII